MAERASHAAEPPAPVAAAMAAADVVLAPTVQSLSHTAARKARQRGGRADRDPARGHRGDARPGDERRHGGAAAEGPGDRRAADGGLGGPDHLRERLRSAARARGAHRRSPTPASSASPAPSATSPAGRASSRRSRGPRRDAWSSTARSRPWGRRDEPVELTVEGGHLPSPAASGRAADGAADRARPRWHQRRRARDRHQREGDPA